MRIAFLCKQLRCLPGSGGLFQQDPYLIDGITFVLEAINEKEAKEAKKRGTRS